MNPLSPRRELFAAVIDRRFFLYQTVTSLKKPARNPACLPVGTNSSERGARGSLGPARFKKVARAWLLTWQRSEVIVKEKARREKGLRSAGHSPGDGTERKVGVLLRGNVNLERSVMNMFDLIKATIACGVSAFLIYSFPVLGQVIIIGLLSLLWLSYAHRTLATLRRR